jgi:4-amino-4-deoxy-L-arabinose transferase-like glycosyltransferase
LGPRATGERWWIALLLAACAVLDLYRLGDPSLFDQDESQYGEIAVEIVQTGDPVTLHANGQPWYVHPPFYMWLVAGTGRLVGFSEFTIRVWSVVFSLLGVYATVLLGRLLFSARVGLLAGAILALTLQYLMQSRLAVFDTVLMAWMLLAFYAFFQGYRSGRRSAYLGFFLFAGLATVTKGPIGLILPGLVIAAFITVRRAWSRWREVPWAGGLAVYAAVGLSWYVAETLLHGSAFIAVNIGHFMLGRFFGVVEKHSAPWYFYVPVALLGGFPWTTFWPAAAALHLRRWREADGSLLVLLGTGVPLVFYTAAQTKLPGYIMPIFPFAALGVAVLWDGVLERRRVNRAIGVSIALLLALVGALFWAVVAFVGAQYPEAFRAAVPVLLVPGGLLVAGAGVALLLSLRGSALAAFAALCLMMAATWIALLAWVLPLAEAQKPIRPLAHAITAVLRPGDRIVAYRMSTATSLVFYTRRHIEWTETEDALRARLCAPGRVFLVITQGELAGLRWRPPRLEPVAERAGTLALLKGPGVHCVEARPLSVLPDIVVAERMRPRATLGAGVEDALVVGLPHQMIRTLAEEVARPARLRPAEEPADQRGDEPGAIDQPLDRE